MKFKKTKMYLLILIIIIFNKNNKKKLGKYKDVDAIKHHLKRQFDL